MAVSVALLNADCFGVLPTLPDGCCDAIVTDIPYVISKRGDSLWRMKSAHRQGLDFGEWDHGFDASRLGALPRVLRKGGCAIVFHSFEQYPVVREALGAAGLVCKDRILWEKTNPMPRCRDRRYVSNVELASWYVRPGAPWVFHRQDPSWQGMVYRFPNVSGGMRRYHPTQKSLALMEALLRVHTDEGAVVLDPFMGGGTTGVACVRLNRFFIGIEKDPAYFRVAEGRINESNHD